MRDVVSKVDLVAVVLTDRVQTRNGGLLLPGETVGLRTDEAEFLVKRGVAFYPKQEEPVRELAAVAPPQQKAPARPTADKMVRGGHTVKK